MHLGVATVKSEEVDMKEFLKKYLTEEQLKEVETKYIADHPEAKGLPIHISKTRLDEVLTQKKAAEEKAAALQLTIDNSASETEKKVAEALKQAKVESDKHEQEAIDALKKDFGATEAIYAAHGRNVKAIKALIDPTKKIEEEIKRLQKSDSYLFDDDLPEGTGKKGGDEGKVDKELANMRQALGI